MTHSEAGKGSARRKEDVSKINENWDRIFKKDKPMNEHDEEPQRSEDMEQSDEDWTCDVCGGPMYSAPHWHYGQCDDCGARQELINDDYT
jgi:rubrerythrin